MSIPFFKTKKEAQDFWGPNRKVLRAYVPKERGFLQARKSGFYWQEEEYVKELGLKSSSASPSSASKSKPTAGQIGADIQRAVNTSGGPALQGSLFSIADGYGLTFEEVKRRASPANYLGSERGVGAIFRIADQAKVNAYIIHGTLEGILLGKDTDKAFAEAAENENFYGDRPDIKKARYSAMSHLRKHYNIHISPSLGESLDEALRAKPALTKKQIQARVSKRIKGTKAKEPTSSSRGSGGLHLGRGGSGASPRRARELKGNQAYVGGGKYSRHRFKGGKRKRMG